MTKTKLTAILVFLNMIVSLCYAAETVSNVEVAAPVVTTTDVVTEAAPAPEPLPIAVEESVAPAREYSPKCIAAMGDYEIATVQQSQAKLLMDQAQEKLNEATLNPFKVFAKSNHQTVLRANQKIFDQSSEDVRKTLIRIANHCGQNFDIFMDEVRTKIYEYVNQSFKENNKNN